MKANIESETGRLKSVLLHTPGAEIENMSPKTAGRELYNDIIPLSVVSGEHKRLKDFLSLVADTREILSLFQEALEDPGVRESFIEDLLPEDGPRHLEAELLALAPRDLAAAAVRGLPQKRQSLTDFLSEREYDFPPVPNLYFARDAAAVVRDGLIVGAMANTVRRTEALILRAIFRGHPEFSGGKIVFDGIAEMKNRGTSLEGGDLLVAKKDLLLFGISERTSAEAVDSLLAGFSTQYNELFHAVAVLLPKERATIHLDMVFTFLDDHTALVHAPVILGTGKSLAVRIHIEPGKMPRFTWENGLLDALRAEGMDLETVVCGGSDTLVQQREQWLSGTNSFAFAPGKILTYDCNSATLEALAKAGFTVRGADSFLSGRDKVENHSRLAVGLPGAELARGGGGVRCMTMPIERDPVQVRFGSVSGKRGLRSSQPRHRSSPGHSPL